MFSAVNFSIKNVDNFTRYDDKVFYFELYFNNQKKII